MLCFHDMLNEGIHGVNNGTFDKYIVAITDYLGGNIEKEYGDAIINLYKGTPGIGKWIHNRIFESDVTLSYDGSCVLCWRTLSFDNAQERKDKLGGSLRKGEEYDMASYSGKIVFSWSIDKRFVYREWASGYYAIFRAKIPFNQVLFATDLYGDWSDGITDDDRFLSLMNKIRYQHEVVVWHKDPIVAHLETIGYA